MTRQEKAALTDVIKSAENLNKELAILEKLTKQMANGLNVKNLTKNIKKLKELTI